MLASLSIVSTANLFTCTSIAVAAVGVGYADFFQLFEQTKMPHDLAGIRRHTDACADLAQDCRLLINRDPKTEIVQSTGRSQTANAGADDCDTRDVIWHGYGVPRAGRSSAFLAG